MGFACGANIKEMAGPCKSGQSGDCGPGGSVDKNAARGGLQAYRIENDLSPGSFNFRKQCQGCAQIAQSTDQVTLPRFTLTT